MNIRLISCFFVVGVTSGCSQMPDSEESVVESSPTNPLVEQRAMASTRAEVMPDDPEYRPIRMTPVTPVDVPNGSLFNANNAIELYKLHKNYRVGDMILIELAEKTSSKKSLEYTNDKSSSFDIGPVSVNAGPIVIEEGDIALEHDQESEFDSSSDTKQTNELDGDITVYVVDVLPNKNLVVAGEKWITLNKGQEFVRFSGEVRVEDISAENSVSSNKVGNARIEYSGKGELQDNQKESLLGSVFSIFK
jgi:flagellar L-ring protein precursor FlgH